MLASSELQVFSSEMEGTDASESLASDAVISDGLGTTRQNAIFIKCPANGPRAEAGADTMVSNLTRSPVFDSDGRLQEAGSILECRCDCCRS